MISYDAAVGILPYLQLDNLDTVGGRDRLCCWGQKVRGKGYIETKYG